MSTADEQLLAQLQTILPEGVSLREPTGKPSWPLVVLEGREGTGKSYNAVGVSSDDRLGPALYIPFGEINIDEYGALPGARFKILEHDGSYRQLHALVHTLVRMPVDLSRPPVIILDSGSNLWSMLSNEADAQARKDKPIDAEVTITPDKWNIAKRKWKGIIDPLLKWPGLVIITARGEETLAMDDNGRPAKDQRGKPMRTYKIEGHKSLPYDAQVIVRCIAPGIGLATKAKTLQFTIPEGGLELPNFDLIGLLFDGMKLGTNMADRSFAQEAPEDPYSRVTADAAKRQLLQVVTGDKDRARALWESSKIEVAEDGTVAREAIEDLVGQVALADAEASESAATPVGADNMDSADAAGVPDPDPDTAAADEVTGNGMAQPDGIDVEEPPAEHPADQQEQGNPEPAVEGNPDGEPQGEPAQQEQAPKDDATVVAEFKQAISEARTATQLAQLRGQVSSLPANVRKAASEAVSAAMRQLREKAPA